MYIYIIAYIVLLCVAFYEFFEDRINNHYLKLFLFIFVLMYLVILSGTRYEVGADFNSYLTIFNNVDSLSESSAYSSLEPGFKLIIIFFKALNFPPYFLFFVFSAILFSFLGVGLKRTSKLPFLSLFIFFSIFWIGYVFNVLRQGIAMSIFIYAISDIKDKKFKKVLFISLLASTIHFTGIFIIFSYFLYHFSFKRTTYITLLVGAIIYYLNSSRFFGLATLVLPSGLENRLIDYMSRFPGGVDFTSYLLRLIIIGFFLWFYNSLKEKKGFKGIFNIYFFGFLLYTLASFQIQAATRVNMFFRILEILLFPYLILIKKDKPQKIIMFWIVVAIASVLFLSDLSHPDNFPFQFFWEF